MALRLPALTVAAATFAALPVLADFPRLLGYQGRLLRADGTAATGTAGATFAVFDAATSGSQLWTESQTLGLSDGYYATFLGTVNAMPDSLFDGGERWLEVRVGSETLSPRQQLGAVAYARTARNVAGGSASVSSLKVGSQTVIDADGRLQGPARYGAGPGLAVDDASQTVSLAPCGPGQTLVRDASTWACSTAGTLTGLDAAAPLAATEGPVPQLSISRAAANASGYLSSADWSSFNARYGSSTQCGGDLGGTLAAPVVTRLQSRAVSGSLPANGQVLKWDAGNQQWEPGADYGKNGTVTSVTAQSPLTAWYGSTTPEISLAQANASTDGYLASADFARFNAKYDAASQCGGDLYGVWEAPAVVKIRGVAVATDTPSTAQVLRFDGAGWAPATLGIADVTGISSGYLSLTGDQSIAGAKIFATAPSFGTALGLASGGTGATNAAGARTALELGAMAQHDTIGASDWSGGPLSVANGGTGATSLSGVVHGSGGALTAGNVNLASEVAGTLAVGSGGTGATSLAGVVHGNGTGAFTAGLVNLSTEVTSTLGVANGGTGAASFAAGQLLVGGGSGALSTFGAGTAGQVLVSGGPGAAPGWTFTPSVAALQVSGGVVAGSFTGSGAGLTDVTASAAVQISDASTTCTSGETGKFRYANGHFQGCNGTAWTQLDNAPAPAITSVTPGLGSTEGGTVVTISGQNFQPLATVTIGGTSCPVVSGSVTATSLQCTTPAASAGPRTVVVVNPDSQSGLKVDGFTYSRPPVVSTVAPTLGSTAGGTVLTITGTDFQTGATVTVGTAGCPVVSGSVTSTSIQCTTAAATAGLRAVTVTNADGLTGSKSDAFSYNRPPVITALSASTGPTRGNRTITITGTDFVSSTVKFGTGSGTGVSVSGTTSITVTTPQVAAAGNVNVVVTNGDGLASNAWTYGYLASGDTAGTAVASCKAVLDAGLSAGSGTYWVTGTSAAQTWCDMTTNNGGWTQFLACVAADGCAPGGTTLYNANWQTTDFGSYSATGSYSLGATLASVITAATEFEVEVSNSSNSRVGQLVYPLNSSTRSFFQSSVWYESASLSVRVYDYDGSTSTRSLKLCWAPADGCHARTYQGLSGMTFLGTTSQAPASGANSGCDYGPWEAQMLLRQPSCSFTANFGVSPVAAWTSQSYSHRIRVR